MIKRKIKQTSSPIVINILLAILLTATAFMGFGNKNIYLMSGALLMFFASVAFFKIKPQTKEEEIIQKIIIIWIAYNALQFLRDGTVEALYMALQHIGVVLFFWYILAKARKEQNSKFLSKYLAILHYAIMLFLILVMIINSQRMSTYESMIYIGLATLPSACLAQKKSSIRIIILSLVWSLIAFITGARAQIIAFMIFAILAIIFSRINIPKKILNKIFIATYIILNLFPLFYVWLSTSQYGKMLNDASVDITSARFFSGRNKIWGSIYSDMNSTWDLLFGQGFTNTRAIVQEGGISLHSLYVTIFSEGGIVFIMILGLLLFAIWKAMTKRNKIQPAYTMALMIAILMKQSFDISLLENNICNAILIWMSLAVGMQEIEDKKLEKLT